PRLTNDRGGIRPALERAHLKDDVVLAQIGDVEPLHRRRHPRHERPQMSVRERDEARLLEQRTPVGARSASVAGTGSVKPRLTTPKSKSRALTLAVAPVVRRCSPSATSIGRSG